MPSLELKIPPPVVLLACVALAWATARIAPDPVLLPAGLRVGIASALALLGMGLGIGGVLAFRRARTTISPHVPAATRAVVRAGPYRFTRNPMYLGLACLLSGFCAWLGNPLALLAVLVFVAYITRFQIRPEERALEEKFGDSFRSYRNAVRRWL